MSPLEHSSDARSVDSDAEQEQVVVIVTPYSTGCAVAKQIQDRGYKTICLWNQGFAEEMKKHIPRSCAGLSYLVELTEEATLAETAAAVRKAADPHGEIVAVLCGGEAGVDLADALSEYMGLLSNGTDIPNRRDKKVQQELIRSAGLRATRQAGGSEWSHVEAFLTEEKYPVIVKPLDSAGSDGVKLCHTFAEAKEHFLYLRYDHEKVNGGSCDEVLCQEYLKGREYVVDHVSLNGVHKTMMVWLYDKREANGASFVYFGDKPVESETEEAKLLIPYAREVLNALGVMNGPSHGEFIMTDDGPCMVEMNVRCHGGDAIWQPLCRGITGGYNQVDGTVAAYLDPEQFWSFPDAPGPFQTFGQCVELVSFSEGIVKSMPGFRRIEDLASFVALETGHHMGSQVRKTVDMATEAGTVVVMNTDKRALAFDIEIIRALEKANALFEYESRGSHSGAAFPSTDMLERKMSVPREPETIMVDDFMAPSMYLERKLSMPKDEEAMFCTRN